MLTINQVIKVLVLQEEMNSKINPNWAYSKNDWALASMMEAVEAIDHYGWKWWKHQSPDLPQVRMELVDIFHFFLSSVIEKTYDNDKSDLAEELHKSLSKLETKVKYEYPFNNEVYALQEMDVVPLLKLFVAEASTGVISMSILYRIMQSCDFTMDDLYKNYIGKNVLNFFRQDNGYKEGTYIKIWDGREDNEHLVEIINELDMEDESVDVTIYENLRLRYQPIKP